MVNIRLATVDDLLQMQTTNLWCLPENYQACLFVIVHILEAVVASTAGPSQSANVYNN